MDKKLLELKVRLLDGQEVKVNYVTFQEMVDELFGDFMGDDIDVHISGNVVKIKLV